VTAADNVSLTVTLGSADSAVLSGVVVDSSGHVLKDHRVVALGRFDADGSPTEVSTVAFESDGTYAITLADGISGPVELIARPIDPMAVAPTLHLGGLIAATATRTVGQPANLGDPAPLELLVKGLSDGGAVVPVPGARVIVVGSYSAGIGTTAHTDFENDATTGSDGVAHLQILNGSALAPSYVVHVIPPSGSNLASLGVAYATPLADTLTTNGSELRLPGRTKISGVVVDREGAPIGNVSITAVPSLRFQWSLDPAPLAFLASIPPATTASSDDGHFVLYVDPLVADTWADYDLTFEPPVSSGEPRWTVADVEIPRLMNDTNLGLGNVAIPDAAFVHGRITDAGGNPVGSGTLSIYQLVTNLSLCGEVAHAPATCAIPARLLGHGVSDASGTVELTLPRP
jgi:hypothetical protein